MSVAVSAAIFLAALAPMLTVPALRRLLVEQHHLGVGAVHLFVAAGMIGAAIGAPLVGMYADRAGRLGRLAACLALTDALATFAITRDLPTFAAFAIRPIHGAASMGLLSLLLASMRATPRDFAVRAGAPMVAALALGPALGGMLTMSSARLPFQAASILSLALAAALATRAALRVGPRPTHPGTTRRADVADVVRSLGAPLLLTASQRFAFGGFVASFAVHAREAYGFRDSSVGMLFSLVLLVFAASMAVVPRSAFARSPLAMVAGAVLFGVGMMALSCVPKQLVLPTLALVGLAAAMVYAPALAFVTERTPEGKRATALSVFHAAGALGMVLGPLAAASLDLVLPHETSPLRAEVFLVLAGATQFACAAVASRLERPASTLNELNGGHES